MQCFAGQKNSPEEIYFQCSCIKSTCMIYVAFCFSVLMQHCNNVQSFDLLYFLAQVSLVLREINHLIKMYSVGEWIFSYSSWMNVDMWNWYGLVVLALGYLMCNLLQSVHVQHVLIRELFPRNFDFLIPDAPELVHTFLEQEQDASCKRNAFMMLIHVDQVH